MGNKADSYPQYVPASKQHWKTTTDCAIKGDLISWSLLGNGLLWSPVNDTIYRPLQFHWMITVFLKIQDNFLHESWQWSASTSKIERENTCSFILSLFCLKKEVCIISDNFKTNTYK